MEFGYFTLSDNRYPDNPRTAEQFLLEIRGQALYAEQLGMHSVWIGEHHFNRRGCVPVPGLTLANIAASSFFRSASTTGSSNLPRKSAS